MSLITPTPEQSARAAYLEASRQRNAAFELYRAVPLGLSVFAYGAYQMRVAATQAAFGAWMALKRSERAVPA